MLMTRPQPDRSCRGPGRGGWSGRSAWLCLSGSLVPLEEGVDRLQDPADPAGRGGAEDDRGARRPLPPGRTGYLRSGYAADLVIFATDEVRDTATFAASNQLPVGIDHVLVNGVEVASEGTWNG